MKIPESFKSFCFFICALQSFMAVLIVSTVRWFHGCVGLHSSHLTDRNVQTVTSDNVHCSTNFFYHIDDFAQVSIPNLKCTVFSLTLSVKCIPA